MLLKTIVAIALALSAAAAPLDDGTEHSVEKRQRRRNCRQVVHGSSQCGHLPANVKWVPSYGGCCWVANGRCPGNNDIKDVLGPYDGCFPIQHGRCPGGEDIKWVDYLEGCARVSACGPWSDARRIVDY